MDIKIFKTQDEVAESLAHFVANTIETVLAQKNVFYLALSGGNTPKLLFAHFLKEPLKSKIEWQKVKIFFCDERYVALDSKENNGKMVLENLIEPLRADLKNFYRIDTSKSAKDAAESYFETIKVELGDSFPVFDLMLLGLGSDAHTASIFPGTAITEVTEIGVQAVELPNEKGTRISLTAPLINLASHVAFFVLGEDKKEAVKTVTKQLPKDSSLYPAQLIAPLDGELIWFLDEKAGAFIA